MSEQIDKLGCHAAEEAIEVLADNLKDVYSVSIPAQDRKDKERLINNKTNTIMEEIINKVTLDDVRKCLDKIGANSQFVQGDGTSVRLLSIIPADETFNHNIMVTFAVQGENNDWLKMQATASGLTINEDDVLSAYLIANKYNNYRRYGKLYIDNYSSDNDEKTIYVYEENLMADRSTTMDSLEGNILLFLTCSWELYSKFIKESRDNFNEMMSEKYNIK